MTALTNHTIDSALPNGYGRCRALSVWISAVQEERRVAFFSFPIMDETNAAPPAHTPGPWAACREECIFEGTPYIAGDDGHGLILAHIQHTGTGNFKGQLGSPMADAILMAASPKLLDACKLALDELGCIRADGEPCQTCKTLQKAIARATAGADVSAPDAPMEELSDWQCSRDYVRNRKILYVLTDDDAQDMAQQTFGRNLTEAELYRVRKFLEHGFGESWADYMQEAVSLALDK